jgi:thiamine-monophosphate kinase
MRCRCLQRFWHFSGWRLHAKQRSVVLAFTMPESQLAGLRAAGSSVHVIGRVEAGQGVCLVDTDAADVTPLARGYQHFQGAQ